MITAKKNGIDAEKLAEKVIKEAFDSARVNYVNELIDFVVNGRFVEVKSCEQYIVDRSHTTNRRRGRFMLNKKQHEFLQENNGLYLFIVRCMAGKSYLKFVEAKELNVDFSNCEMKSISWKKVFSDDYETIE